MRSGLVAEFASSDRLVETIHSLRREGITAMDAHLPYPVEEVIEALELPPSRVPLYCLLGGLTGATYGYLIQWWTNGFDYALNVAGRPLGSTPAFIPPTFEGTILLAAFGAVLSFFALSKLPRLWTPISEAPALPRATMDRFILAVDAESETFDHRRAEDILLAKGALSVAAFGLPEAREEEVQP